MADWEDVPEEEIPMLIERTDWENVPTEDIGKMRVSGVPVGTYAGESVPSPQEAFMQGAKMKGMDFLEGAQQAYYSRQHPLIGQPELTRLEQQRAVREAEYQPIQEIYPLQTGAGEAAAYLPSMALPGGPLRQMMYGGALEGMQYDQGTMDALEGAGWSAAGYAAGKMAPRIAAIIAGTAQNIMGMPTRMVNRATGKSATARMAPDLNPKDQRLLSRADEMEMFTYPSMRWGSKPMSQIEQSAKASPFLSGLTEDQIIGNQQKLNRLALDSIGEKGDIFMDDTFYDAAKRIGGVYDDVAKGRNINISPDKFDDIRPDISEEAEMLLNSYFRKYPELEFGTIRGEQFSRLRNRVAADVRLHLKRGDGDPEGVSMILDIMDKALEEQVPGSKEALRKAGQQWKNLKALESIGAVSNEGNVNPRTVGNRLKVFDLGGFWRGRNKSEYYDAIRIGRRWPDMFVTGPAKTSETATLQWLMRAASDPGTTATGLTMRPIYKSYLESGGDLGYATMLGAIPRGVDTTSVRAGTTAGRGIGGAEFEELK